MSSFGRALRSNASNATVPKLGTGPVAAGQRLSSGATQKQAASPVLTEMREAIRQLTNSLAEANAKNERINEELTQMRILMTKQQEYAERWELIAREEMEKMRAAHERDRTALNKLLMQGAGTSSHRAAATPTTPTLKNVVFVGFTSA